MNTVHVFEESDETLTLLQPWFRFSSDNWNSHAEYSVNSPRAELEQEVEREVNYGFVASRLSLLT